MRRPGRGHRRRAKASDGARRDLGGEAVLAVRDVVADAFRQEWGRINATLIRQTGDWDLAEECAQEAFAQALNRWPRDGVPDRPGAWLTTVARNAALDRLRRAGTYRAKVEEMAVLASRETGTGNRDPGTDGMGVPDERLRLIFTCCHPALAMEARVALTLRTLTGLSTAEIARAFLVPEATMAKRLVRAKAKIANARIPYRVPPASALPERLPGVLTVLYLVFNEGYSATAGDDLIRHDLCDRAVELAKVLIDLAAIAGCHAAARTAEATDWPKIARLYRLLSELTGSPVVELNRAVAVAMAGGAAAGLSLLTRLEAEGALAGYYLLPATRADLLRRLGRNAEAAAAYQEAAALAGTGPERRFLTARLAEVQNSTSQP